MDRRTFLCGLTLGTLSTLVAGEAEQTARAYRIGYLSSIPIPLHGRTHLMEAFGQGLRETGFTPGLNLTIELRSPRCSIQDDEHLRRLAAEMVDRFSSCWQGPSEAVKMVAVDQADPRPRDVYPSFSLTGPRRALAAAHARATGASSARPGTRRRSGAWATNGEPLGQLSPRGELSACGVSATPC